MALGIYKVIRGIYKYLMPGRNQVTQSQELVGVAERQSRKRGETGIVYHLLNNCREKTVIILYDYSSESVGLRMTE